MLWILLLLVLGISIVAILAYRKGRAWIRRVLDNLSEFLDDSTDVY